MKLLSAVCKSLIYFVALATNSFRTTATTTTIDGWMDVRERFIRFDFKAILEYTLNAHNAPKNKCKPIYQSYGGKLKKM